MDMLAIEQLQFPASKPADVIPKPTPSLLERIRDHGAVDPVVVRPLPNGKYEILSNPETWLAAGELKLESVPVVIRDDLDDDQAADIVQDHYVLRHRNPIEEAKYFEALLDRFGGHERRGSITKLAHHLKRSRAYVAHALRLLNLPPKIQEMISTGILPAGKARPLVTIKSRSEQLRLADDIVKNKLTTRSVETAAKSYREGEPTAHDQSAKPAASIKSPDIVRLERQVSAIIGTEFTIDEGRAVINFHGSNDILEGVLQKLGYRG